MTPDPGRDNGGVRRSARASGQVELADKIEGWLVQYREHLKKAEPVGKQP